MRISGGEGHWVGGVSGSAGVLQAAGDGDQLAAGACQVDEVQT